MNTWQEAFQIRTSEVDLTGRASIQSICSLLQEVASNHAHQLQLSVEHLKAQQIFWALARLRVVMNRYPNWRDTVRIETWPSGEEGLFATREFLIRDDQDVVIGKASSNWVLLDLEKRRPVRLPSYITELRVPQREYPLPGPAPRLRAPEEAAFERNILVRRSDLDLNRHVNNVRFIEWVIETIPTEDLEAHPVTELDVVFRAETYYGDEVITRAARSPGAEDLGFDHVLVRTSDGKEVALAHTRLGA